MGFINKLIKKVFFGLIVVFSFFLFTNGVRVAAEDTDVCTLSLNDGDKYLVLNSKSAWNDSGVTATCTISGFKNTISVTINGGTPIATTNGGLGVANSYVTSPGFYKIQYYLTGDTTTAITRHVRVLPENINNSKNLWLGENENVNTSSDDAFNKIIDTNSGYLAIGNFGDMAYIAKFNLRGEFVWVDKYGNTDAYTNFQLTDIIKASTENKLYYIAGQFTNASSETKGFVKAIQLNDNGGINSSYGNIVELNEMVQVNRIIKANDNYLFAAGYGPNERSIIVGKIAKLTIENVANLIVPAYYNNPLNSQYNSIITSIEGTTLKIVAVGNTSIEANAGATGGLVTVCGEDLVCENKDPYLYLNSNLASTTITRFNDIIKSGDNYLIVGESRVDRINGATTSINSGIEDALVVMLGSDFKILDAKLRGSSSSDTLVSIKQINDSSFLAVGNRASAGYYSAISIENNELVLVENTISGNLTVELKDTFIYNGSDGETQYVFVGSTQSTNIEGVLNSIVGSVDSLLAILDITEFSNFEDINILQDSIICTDDATECTGDKVIEEYWIAYGSKKTAFPVGLEVSSETVNTYNTYHDFSNNQGIKFKIGRIIYINANPVAPDITISDIGIDKWYLYSRPQIIGSNPANTARKDLWNEYYYPVDNNQTKDANTTYYTFSGSTGVFSLDNSSRTYTYNNYIELADEEQSLDVAFQSIEKAYSFAILQEFTRIAYVKEKYINRQTNGMEFFQNELASLSNQSYYFVYYIDLSFGTGSCGLTNGALGGNCTAYTGYAFASLARIKTIANLIIEKSNYFVSENNNRFNLNSGIALPTTDEYKEEMSTIRYVQNLTVNLANTLELVVNFEAIKSDYTYESPVTTTVTGVSSVLFGTAENNARYIEEGKYTVKYCYNYGKANVNCGASATFVIDRTAPKINYELISDRTKNSISKTYLINDPETIKTDMRVDSIKDIDPYAYTIVDGKKYYLQCNAEVNSSLCGNDLVEKVKRTFAYQSDDPDKIFEIHVYDRAGNVIDFYFKIGTVKPTIRVDDSVNSDSFVLNIEFYNRNKIDSLFITYTASEENASTNAEEIQNKIKLYIDALIYLNNQELLKLKEDPEYNAVITTFIDLTFTVSRVDSGNVSGGLIIPKVEIDQTTGAYSILENENETLAISKGLYEFTLADKFSNIDNAYGGIGIDKAELYTYINDLDNENNKYVENLEDIKEGNGRKPVTDAEYGSTESTTTFIAREPDTYKYSDKLQDSVLNDFNNSMFFTNQFVYIKFKVNTYGIIRISEAKNLNQYNNYIINNTMIDNITCLFSIYGENADIDTLGCGTLIKISEIASASEALAGKGIYSIGELAGYYYFVFTNDGTYRVDSEVRVKTGVTDENGNSVNLVATPVSYSFAIDSKEPTVEFELSCSGTSCKGEKNQFELGDFVYDDASRVKVNIGNYDIKLLLNTDILMSYGEEDNITNVQNKLLVIMLNGEVYNAFDYSIDNGDDGEYILFRESGIYEITFIDAGDNTITYRFIIDKEPPVIQELVDINNKSFSEYQQFVEVRLTISDGTFLLNNTESQMLNIQYGIGNANKTVVGFSSDGTRCEISAGSGYLSGEGLCTITDNGGIAGLSASFVIEINKNERNSDTQTLNMILTDYFGNVSNASQSFIFDNEKPYLYFDSSYTPITIFGEEPTNEERERMLSMDADASLTNFVCESDTTLISGKVICNDSPTIQNVNNNVVVEAYEASRAAYNNYRRNNSGEYELIANGTPLLYNDTTTKIYKRTYSSFVSESSLQSAIDGGVTIYTKGKYVQVETNEKIDPNINYYYGEEKELVTIKEMYTNTTEFANYGTCSESNKTCLLYRMYIDQGYFIDTNYYIYDREDYSQTTTINSSNYLNYYFTTDSSFVEDDGKYLPALTLANSCVMVNSGTCRTIGEGRIKLNSFDSYNFIYYNFIDQTYSTGTRPTVVNSITVVNELSEQSTKLAVVDNRIWQIAEQNNSEGYPEVVKFRFGIASNLGRPIIFKATDGAGNLSVNYLETVIAIKDEIPPSVANVSSITYSEDTRGTTATSNNYIKTIKYYKMANTDGINCTADTIYYKYDSTRNEYVSVTCGDWNIIEQYYAQVEVYEKVADGINKDSSTTYYVLNSNGLENNYLTKEDLSIEFDEPISRVICSYYAVTAEGTIIDKQCSFNNAEFDYIEDKKQFQLIYEEVGSYYVNYNITVYDFSNNTRTINYLFIDREKPTIEFNSIVRNEDQIEVNYVPDESKETKYNQSYIDSGFRNEVYSVDGINNRINSIGANSLVDNTLSYTIKYFKFNYGITYKNYIKSGNAFIKVDDGTPKVNGQTYYILIKETSDYVLKGNSGVCANGYCYVEDSYSYYPSLVSNSAYWTQLGDNEAITNAAVGVYKAEYIVTDYSGNASDTLIKTIYIVDTQKPILNINGTDTTELYGYHREVDIIIHNEYEAVLYKYTCKDSMLTCELPSEIFTTYSASDKTVRVVTTYTDELDILETAPGIYKIYFHDLGSYVNSSICTDTSDCESNAEEIKTLKYNYIEYQYVIDRTPPSLNIIAIVDETTNKLYYEASLTQEENLYCVKGLRGESLAFGQENLDCTQFLMGARTLTETAADGKSIKVSLLNYNGETVSERVFQKLDAGAQKYYYNTYYYKSGDELFDYLPGANYDEDNVYIINSIKLIFREDGKYLIKAVDQAGNQAGRIESGGTPKGEFSEIEIDNTAPTYNKEQNAATGINYWFSVPSRVINSQNIDFVLNDGLVSNGTNNIMNSVLNNEFFYAFATKKEANEYLTTIYTNHINAQADNNCTKSGYTGFSYDYFDGEKMKPECFVSDQAGESNKDKAKKTVESVIKQMIYPTYSGNLLFGDSNIDQIACDSTTSSVCANSKDMYKFVYLKKENNTATGREQKTIVETCSESDSVTCIKINVKIVGYTSNLNSSYEIGGINTGDTQSIVVYSKSKNGPTSISSELTSTGTYGPLAQDTYYIFEEKDSAIPYTNYAVSGSINHYNTTYYAIYVDNTSYLSVFTGEENTENVITINATDIVNTDGIATQNINNSSNFYLILKNNGNLDFINNYEIHESWKGEELLEVYSYLRVKLDVEYNEVHEEEYINLNDPKYFVKEGNEYYYKILITKEAVTSVDFIDRAGNITRIKISHSQEAPSINLVYDGEGADQTITLSIRNSALTAVQTDSIKVAFSKDGTNYSEVNAANIKAALLCQSEPIGYIKSCSNINGRSSYSIIIENKEELYGFFKVSLNDTHGNSNEVIFIYNPADLSANYITGGLKFIDANMSSENIRMVSNQSLQIEWNNLINYLILYKETTDGLVQLCNTKNMGTGNGSCGSDQNNRVEANSSTSYTSSTLYYADEGYYQAKIINRQSEEINTICIVNGEVSEECKKIKTHTSNICSWENNPDYCAEALNTVQEMVSKVNVNSTFTRFEIDKTPPIYDESNFVVELPQGTDTFRNNAIYVNAEVRVKWEDEFVDLWYTCRYLDGDTTEHCAGNHTGASATTKEYLFSIGNRRSTEYTFWLVDYAGNSTEGENTLRFTIQVKLPEIEVYEVDQDGAITTNPIVKNTKVNKNAELVCSLEGKVVNCTDTYSVRLYRATASGYQQISIINITRVSENFENTYRYVVAIKRDNGTIYENLSVEYIFTIDKVAPNITIDGDRDELLGIYKNDVRVLVDSNGIGTIYNKCVISGVDEGGNKLYDCDETPLVDSFTSNYTLSETGTYKIIARDEIGNVTTGSAIGYVTIDNENPEISIRAKTTYLEYELSENGYTNASVVVVESKDNNEQSYFMYRMKNADGLYGEWTTTSFSTLEISEEGFYEVKPVDIIGNEGIERHFIIYRQTPKYYVYVDNKVNTINDILTKDALITWEEPKNDLEAPIIKVTVNGQPYTKRDLIKETGEYVFVFFDLAGNTATHRLTINKSDRICLDNVGLVPNKQYLFPSNSIKFSGEEGYEFKEDDVIIFATPTNYYGGSSSCGENTLSYKSLDKDAYIVINKSTAAHINSNKNVSITMSEEYINKINELGGYVYAIIVDKDVAKKELGFEIGENFFTKDPLGWSLIIIAGVALIYVGLKIVVFKKKVKVLK